MEATSIKISDICSVEIKEHMFSYELIITTSGRVHRFKNLDSGVFSTKMKIDEAVEHYIKTGEDDILKISQTSYFQYF